MPGRRYDLVCEGEERKQFKRERLKSTGSSVTSDNDSMNGRDYNYELEVVKSPRAPLYEVHYVKTRKKGIHLVRKKAKIGRKLLDKKRNHGDSRSVSNTCTEDEETIASETTEHSTDEMVGLRVIACNRHDGLYYPGTVCKTPATAFAIVTFNNKKQQKVRTQMIIPMSGAIARPELAPGDFVLVRVYNQTTDVECYVPGIVEVTPEDFRQHNKFYSVLLYNGQRETTMRKLVVKIGRARFEMAIRYITHLQQQRLLREKQALLDNSSITSPKSTSSKKSDDETLSQQSSQSGRGRRKKEKLTKKLKKETGKDTKSKRKSRSRSPSGSRTNSSVSTRRSSPSSSRSRSRSSKASSRSRSRSRSNSRSRSRSNSRSRSRSRSRSLETSSRSSYTRSDSSRSRTPRRSSRIRRDTYTRSSQSSKSRSPTPKRKSKSRRRKLSRSNSRTRALKQSSRRNRVSSRSSSNSSWSRARSQSSKNKSRSKRSPRSRSSSSSSSSTVRSRSSEKKQGKGRRSRTRPRSPSVSSRSRSRGSEKSGGSSTPRVKSPYDRPHKPEPNSKRRSEPRVESRSESRSIRKDIYYERNSRSEQTIQSDSRVTDASRIVNVDEKDEMIQTLQHQIEKQKRKQLRQERRLVRQARKINKIQRKMRSTDTSQNDSVNSTNTEKSVQERIVASSYSETDASPRRRKGSPDGRSYHEPAVEVINSSRSISDSVLNQEVLARWTDDGWYYRGYVVGDKGDGQYIVKDNTGYMEIIDREDILTSADHRFNPIQPEDYVIGLHPKYTFSYAPAEVLSIYSNDCVKVELFDGNLADLNMDDVYRISKPKYDQVVEYIMKCEKHMIGKSVVAREDNSGLYKLGLVDSRVGLGQTFYIKWLDGDMSKQNSNHIFEVGKLQASHDTWCYVLAPTSNHTTTYMPAEIIQSNPPVLQFCDGRRQGEVTMDQCFWISKEYYSNARSFLLDIKQRRQTNSQ